MEIIAGIDGKEKLSQQELKSLQELSKLDNTQLKEKIGEDKLSNFKSILEAERDAYMKNSTNETSKKWIGKMINTIIGNITEPEIRNLSANPEVSGLGNLDKKDKQPDDWGMSEKIEKGYDYTIPGIDNISVPGIGEKPEIIEQKLCSIYNNDISKDIIIKSFDKINIKINTVDDIKTNLQTIDKDKITTVISSIHTIFQELEKDRNIEWGDINKGSLLQYIIDYKEKLENGSYLIPKTGVILGDNVIIRGNKAEDTNKRIGNGEKVDFSDESFSTMIKVHNEKTGRDDYYIKIGEGRYISANFIKVDGVFTKEENSQIIDEKKESKEVMESTIWEYFDIPNAEGEALKSKLDTYGLNLDIVPFLVTYKNHIENNLDGLKPSILEKITDSIGLRVMYLSKIVDERVAFVDEQIEEGDYKKEDRAQEIKNERWIINSKLKESFSFVDNELLPSASMLLKYGEKYGNKKIYIRSETLYNVSDKLEEINKMFDADLLNNGDFDKTWKSGELIDANTNTWNIFDTSMNTSTLTNKGIDGDLFKLDRIQLIEGASLLDKNDIAIEKKAMMYFMAGIATQVTGEIVLGPAGMIAGGGLDLVDAFSDTEKILDIAQATGKVDASYRMEKTWVDNILAGAGLLPGGTQLIKGMKLGDWFATLSKGDKKMFGEVLDEAKNIDKTPKNTKSFDNIKVPELKLPSFDGIKGNLTNILNKLPDGETIKNTIGKPLEWLKETFDKGFSNKNLGNIEKTKDYLKNGLNNTDDIPKSLKTEIEKSLDGINEYLEVLKQNKYIEYTSKSGKKHDGIIEEFKVLPDGKIKASISIQGKNSKAGDYPLNMNKGLASKGNEKYSINVDGENKGALVFDNIKDFKKYVSSREGDNLKNLKVEKKNIETSGSKLDPIYEKMKVNLEDIYNNIIGKKRRIKEIDKKLNDIDNKIISENGGEINIGESVNNISYKMGLEDEKRGLENEIYNLEVVYNREASSSVKNENITNMVKEPKINKQNLDEIKEAKIDLSKLNSYEKNVLNGENGDLIRKLYAENPNINITTINKVLEDGMQTYNKYEGSVFDGLSDLEKITFLKTLDGKSKREIEQIVDNFNDIRLEELNKEVIEKASEYRYLNSEKNPDRNMMQTVEFEWLINNTYNSDKVVEFNTVGWGNKGEVIDVVVDNYQNLNGYHLITLKEPLVDGNRYLKFKTINDLTAHFSVDFNRQAN